MELNELTKKIAAMHTAMQARIQEDTQESMRLYMQGYCDGLDAVTATIKKAIDAERMRQRLARLEDELAQEPEPALPALTALAEQPAGEDKVTLPDSDSVEHISA